MSCIFANNVSTAYGKRRKWWEESYAPVPPTHAIYSSCDDPFCFAPEHAVIRAKPTPNVWKGLFGHVLQRLIDLPAGGTIGLAFAPDTDIWHVSLQLRSLLGVNKALYLNRWSVRVREDDIIVVGKIGRFGGFRENLETEDYELFVEAPKPKPRQCACGCGETATGGAFVEGHLSIALKMKLCPSCGIAFDKPTQCCSQPCAAKYRSIRRALGYRKTKPSPTAHAY